MGIVTDPGYELFGLDFLTCFAAGKTPKKFYCSVQSIVPYAGTPPDAPSPPNGIFLLEQELVPGMWHHRGSFWHVWLDYTGARSELSIETPGHTLAFFGSDVPSCLISFTSIGAPFLMFAGGIASVAPRPYLNPRPTLKGVMKLLNIEPGRKTFAELFPHEDGDTVFKYNIKADKTNVKIKIDPAVY